MLCLSLLLALLGVRAAICEPAAIDLLLKWTVAGGMAVICVADARRMRRPMPGLAPLGIMIAWPVAVPIYLVWSRGWRRGLVLAGAFALAGVVLVLVPYYVAGYAVWGEAFF